MRVPDTIRKCAGFIAVQDPNTAQMIHLGTGFVVSVRGEVGNHFAFLVTARHIAERIENREWLFRMNTTSGSTVEMVARPNTSKWYYHPCERQYVDAAATLFAPPKNQGVEVDFRSVPSEMFISEEAFPEKGIGVGDEVFITGLFSKVIETTRVLPIIRIGNVAMIPGEKIPDGNNLIEAYLIEARSIGGLSGSPVFVRETLTLRTMQPKPGIKINQVNDRYPGESLETIEMLGAGRFYLFGSAVGHWDLPAGMPMDNERVNMGISLVTPARKILEILMQPELKSMMDRVNQELREEKEADSKATEDVIPVFTKDQIAEAVRKAEKDG